MVMIYLGYGRECACSVIVPNECYQSVISQSAVFSKMFVCKQQKQVLLTLLSLIAPN